MTTPELAALLGEPAERMRELLAELRAAGHIEPSPTGWRLTSSAEARFGPALRTLSPTLDAGGQPIPRRDSEPARITAGATPGRRSTSRTRRDRNPGDEK